MKGNGSPLGRYAALVAAVVILGVVIAALYGHTVGHPDTLIDTAFVLVLGIVTGTAGSLTMLNGTVQRTDQQDAELTELRRQVVALHEKVEP